MSTATDWKGELVVVMCDRCGSQTEVHRRHFICATAFSAPIWCPGCVLTAQHKSR